MRKIISLGLLVSLFVLSACQKNDPSSLFWGTWKVESSVTTYSSSIIGETAPTKEDYSPWDLYLLLEKRDKSDIEGFEEGVATLYRGFDRSSTNILFHRSMNSFQLEETIIVKNNKNDNEFYGFALSGKYEFIITDLTKNVMVITSKSDVFGGIATAETTISFSRIK